MPHNISFFAIHADDVERGKRFYANVFGWRFDSWGPPGFYLIQTGDALHPGILGALQKRQEPLEGKGCIGYECTIAVDDVDAIAKSIEANGGSVVMRKAQIPTVGWLIKFKDTENNVACAMQYEQPQR